MISVTLCIIRIHYMFEVISLIMKLFSFPHCNDPEYIEVNLEDLQFLSISDDIEKAEFIDGPDHTYGNEVTVLRIKDGGRVSCVAVRFYAGVTEDNEDIAIHLCIDEEIERLAITYRYYRNTGDIIREEYQSFPYVPLYLYRALGGDIWE